jgi:hypothetical protein
VEEPIQLETHTNIKVKALKELIKERAPIESGLTLVAAERLVVQIEGGDILKKSSLFLEDAGIKKDCNLIVTVSDKPVRSSDQAAAAKERRALKDEPKVQIIYTLRNPIEAVDPNLTAG